MTIIGICGQPASGKDTAADFFVSKGFVHIPTGDILREEMRRAGILIDRPHTSAFGMEIKQKHGMGYLAELAAGKIKGNAVVSGLRAVMEIETLRRRFGKDFVLISVDAPLRTRYERARKRNRPGDNISFETFKKQEDHDRSHPSGAQEVDKVVTMADKTIDNSGSIAELNENLAALIG